MASNKISGISGDCVTDVKINFVEIDGKIDQIMQAMERIKEKQEEMAADISKIKDAVYDPDEGLYARLRELENWKNTSTRLIWIIVSALTVLTIGSIYKLLFP